MNWAKHFLKRTKELRLDDCHWALTDLAELDGQCGFACEVCVVNCHQMQCVLKSTQYTPSNAFGELEKLYLWNMKHLEQICQGQLLAQ